MNIRMNMKNKTDELKNKGWFGGGGGHFLKMDDIFDTEQQVSPVRWSSIISASITRSQCSAKSLFKINGPLKLE